MSATQLQSVGAHFVCAPRCMDHLDSSPWMGRAACRNEDPDLFFPDNDAYRQILEAKEVCLGCPVVAQCAEYAIARPELAGIWGGLTRTERRNRRWGKSA